MKLQGLQGQRNFTEGMVDEDDKEDEDRGQGIKGENTEARGDRPGEEEQGWLSEQVLV